MSQTILWSIASCMWLATSLSKMNTENGYEWIVPMVCCLICFALSLYSVLRYDKQMKAQKESLQNEILDIRYRIDTKYNADEIFNNIRDLRNEIKNIDKKMEGLAKEQLDRSYTHTDESFARLAALVSDFDTRVSLIEKNGIRIFMEKIKKGELKKETRL